MPVTRDFTNQEILVARRVEPSIDIANKKHIYMIGRQTEVNNTAASLVLKNIFAYVLICTAFNSSSDSRKHIWLKNPSESSGGISSRIQLLTAHKNAVIPYLMEPCSIYTNTKKVTMPPPVLEVAKEYITKL